MAYKSIIYPILVFALLSTTILISARKYVEPVTPVIVTALKKNLATCHACSKEAMVSIAYDDTVLYCCKDHVPTLENAGTIHIVVYEGK